MADYDLKYTGQQIDALLDAANELKTNGYIYKGVATPSTNPGTPTERVAYLASEPGTYTNFGGIVITSGLYSLTYASGTWTGTQMQAGSDIEVVQTTGQSASDVMSQKAVTEAIDEIQENLTELGEKHPYISTIPSEADLAFSDTEGYDIVRFIDGGVQTKNFNSATLPDFSLTNLSGKKIAFIGDSITAGSSASTASNRYLNVFCSLVGATFVNLGISGTGLCTNMKNNLSSQRFVTRATAANLNDVDMIVVFGGTNDFSYDSKPIGDFFVEETITGGTYIGTKKKIPPTDTDTFSGALHELINTIRGLKPETPILFMTPLNRGRYNSTRPISSEANANGDYLQDYVSAIKTICEFYAIPVFDSGSAMNSDWTSQVAGSITNPLTEDGLHPTDAGHIRLGKLLYKYVMSNFVI